MLAVVVGLDPGDRRRPQGSETVAVLAFAGFFEQPQALAVELAFSGQALTYLSATLGGTATSSCGGGAASITPCSGNSFTNAK
jgi:hypothetical protein